MSEEFRVKHSLEKTKDDGAVDHKYTTYLASKGIRVKCWTISEMESQHSRGENEIHHYPTAKEIGGTTRKPLAFFDR